MKVPSDSVRCLPCQREIQRRRRGRLSGGGKFFGGDKNLGDKNLCVGGRYCPKGRPVYSEGNKIIGGTVEGGVGGGGRIGRECRELPHLGDGCRILARPVRTRRLVKKNEGGKGGLSRELPWLEAFTPG